MVPFGIISLETFCVGQKNATCDVFSQAQVAGARIKCFYQFKKVIIGTGER